MDNLWKTNGKLMERPWATHGKLTENYWKTVSQTHPNRKAPSEPSETPEPKTTHFGNGVTEIDLRNASRRAGMHPDAQKDFQVLRIIQIPQNCLNLFTQILSMVAKWSKLKRSSRSHAKPGSKNLEFRVWGPPKTGPPGAPPIEIHFQSIFN